MFFIKCKVILNSSLNHSKPTFLQNARSSYIMVNICEYNLSKHLIMYKMLQPPVFFLIKCKVILSQGMDFADWGHTRLIKWYLESAFYKGKGSSFYRGSFWGIYKYINVDSISIFFLSFLGYGLSEASMHPNSLLLHMNKESISA